jgi:hypothetical protein
MNERIFLLRRAFIFSMMLLVVSCAGMKISTTKPAIPRIPFPEDEYAKLPISGTGTVSGSAFIKLGGNIKAAVGERVILNPVTSYSKQWYTVSYLGQNQLEPPDKRIGKYLKFKIADAQGRFTFKNVPPGEYYIITVVSWEEPVGSQGTHVSQGARLCKIITVKNHEETKVILKQ